MLNVIAVAAYFASAALVSQPTVERQYADRDAPLWTHIAPYVPAVGMLAVFVAEAFIGPERTVDPVLLGATADESRTQHPSLAEALEAAPHDARDATLSHRARRRQRPLRTASVKY